MTRKTKIICTLGPATDDLEVLRRLMTNGMNCARINFSHGQHEDHLVRINAVKKMRDELNLPIALLLDTKGPEIRTGDFEDGKIQVEKGQTFTLTPKDILGDQTRTSITYKNLSKDVIIGTRIMVDDGLIEMEVTSIDDGDVVCKIINGGVISNHKGINVPSVELGMEYMSQKDIDDIKFGIEQDFDFIAASFVRSGFDVLEIRRILEQNNCDDIQIISKIENRQGVDNIESILKVSDGIMIARGDMGVEISFDELPSIQKKLIKQCYSAGKKVITATQMLESITHNPRPTRAEISDVANAVYDGTSAVMLSGETAVGEHPVLALETMAQICRKTEEDIDYIKRFENMQHRKMTSVSNAISHSSCTTAHDIGAAAIITVTQSGYTSRQVSSYRPECPIIGGTLNKKIWRQLNLSWGVTPILTEYKETSDELFEHAVNRAIEDTNIVVQGDAVVLTGSSSSGISGTTNILKVQLVGDVLATGHSISNRSICGKICVAKNNNDAINKFEDGDIIVVKSTSNTIISILKRASAIITETSGSTSHAAIVGMTLGIPVLVGVKEATKILKHGTTVTIDGNRGQIYSGVAKIV